MNDSLVNQQMTTPVCNNCLEALCAYPMTRIGTDRVDCLKHYTGSVGHHADDGGDVHSLCTRPKKVRVKGCGNCPWERLPFSSTSVAVCSHPKGPRGVKATIKSQGAFLNGCPLFTDGKPNAGIHLVATEWKLMPNLGPCWCGKLLTSILHDAPYREAGLWPTLECPDHGVWTDPQEMWLRFHQTLETLDAMEARAIKAEQQVQELRKAVKLVKKMLDNPHVYRTDAGLLSDLLGRAMEHKT